VPADSSSAGAWTQPLFVFLSLWFGGWLWGIAGVALAVPCSWRRRRWDSTRRSRAPPKAGKAAATSEDRPWPRRTHF